MQERLGSRNIMAMMEEKGAWSKSLSDDVQQYIQNRNSCYLATSSADGQPYIQHRGGPKGFVKVIDKNTLAFADFSGNRHYITTGNLSENNNVQLFFMDYANQRRVKVWGTAKVIEADDPLVKKLTDSSYKATIERAIVIDVSAWDINCAAHIPRLHPEENVAIIMKKLEDRIDELEAELKKTIP